MGDPGREAALPGKPIKYLMLTHHHWDHANGARTFVAEGATIIVGKDNKAHFERMFSARASCSTTGCTATRVRRTSSR